MLLCKYFTNASGAVSIVNVAASSWASFYVSIEIIFETIDHAIKKVCCAIHYLLLPLTQCAAHIWRGAMF